MTIDRFFPYAGKSSGRNGNATEMAVKSYISGRTVKTVRKQGKADAFVTYPVEAGKRGQVTLEIKTACGRIDHAPEAQFIAYWPEPMEDCEVETSVVVFSREAWVKFVNGYRKPSSFVRVDKATGYLHIQSFRGLLSGARPKASLPIAEYIYEACENQPTLEEWLSDLRRQ